MSDSTHTDNQHADTLLSEHARKNRAMWEVYSDSYEERHALALSGEKAMAWGISKFRLTLAMLSFNFSLRLKWIRLFCRT